ncbi:MAG: beta-galactosidase, partial [Abditibacteriota bacterium]|nr:beta-galactosidase [Abditibacteriota bacterium]
MHVMNPRRRVSALSTRALTTILSRLAASGVAIASVAALCDFASSARAQEANNWVWIEAQDHASINVTKNDKRKIEVGGWGRTHFLSDGSWLQITIDEGNVEAQVPEEGILLSYRANVAAAGSYEIWNRLGMEFVRSPFEWRIDGDAWQEVSPEVPTTDLMALETWTEVAWLKLADRQLTAGAHSLEIRLPRRKDDKGKFQKVFYTSDALLLHPGRFVPNGPNKPNENFNQFVAAERDRARQMAQAAAQKVFELPTVKAAPGTRVGLPLEGDWEIARHDETLPTEVGVPIPELPTAPRWTSIPVPSDKNASRPDLLFAHRIWYRTRVSVPEQYLGRSFGLTFPLNNLNTTVYVNGVLCGFNKNPFAKFDIDVSKAIKSGQNEIWVGIRDAWYGFTANPAKPMKLRRMWNYPHDWWNKGFMDLAYPVWNSPQSGLLEAPTFWVAGNTYAADVFVKPSVAQRQLNAELTLINSGTQSTSGEVQWAAIDNETGSVAKTFASRPFTVRAGAQSTLELSDAWTNPQLWWPDTPHLYRLRTSIVVNGEAIDVRETTFGFREWTTRGIDFLLNGVRWQMWADLTPLPSKTTTEFLKKYRETHQRTFRLMMPGQGGGQWRYLGMSLQDALSFFDRNGVVVRRNGPLDGEVIGYKFSEDDPDLKAKYGTEVKMELMQNWRDQMVAQVKGERHHPSINIWTIENEFAYINLINLLGNSP